MIYVIPVASIIVPGARVYIIGYQKRAHAADLFRVQNRCLIWCILHKWSHPGLQKRHEQHRSADMGATPAAPQ